MVFARCLDDLRKSQFQQRSSGANVCHEFLFNIVSSSPRINKPIYLIFFLSVHFSAAHSLGRAPHAITASVWLWALLIEASVAELRSAREFFFKCARPRGLVGFIMPELASGSKLRPSTYVRKANRCRDPGSNRGPSDLQSDALPLSYRGHVS